MTKGYINPAPSVVSYIVAVVVWTIVVPGNLVLMSGVLVRLEVAGPVKAEGVIVCRDWLGLEA